MQGNWKATTNQSFRKIVLFLLKKHDFNTFEDKEEFSNNQNIFERSASCIKYTEKLRRHLAPSPVL